MSRIISHWRVLFTNSREVKILFALGAVHFSHLLDFMILMPISTLLMTSLDINITQYGYLISTYLAGACLFTFIGFFYIDRFDRKKIFTLTLLGFFSSLLLSAFAVNFTMLLLIRFVVGAFAGLSNSLLFSSVGDLIEEDKRSKAIGWIAIAYSVATIIGVPLGVLISKFLSWRILYILLAVLGFGILYFLHRFYPKFNHRAAATAATKKANPLHHFFIFFLMTGQFLIIPFLAPFMMINQELSEIKVSLSYSYAGLASIFIFPFIGKLSDQIGKNKILCYILILLMVLIVYVTHLLSAPDAILISLISSYIVVSGCVMIPANSLMTSLIAADKRGGFMSLVSSIQYFSLGLASFVGSLIIQTNTSNKILNYASLGYVALFCCLAVLLILLKLNLTN
ncbi:MAG: MFS transporter [Bacteroidota bacterium]